MCLSNFVLLNFLHYFTLAIAYIKHETICMYSTSASRASQRDELCGHITHPGFLLRADRRRRPEVPVVKEAGSNARVVWSRARAGGGGNGSSGVGGGGDGSDSP